MKNLVGLLFIFCVAVTANSQSAAKDLHSYSNPQDVRVRHLDLDWDVSFDKKILKGAAILTIDRLNKQAPLILDTRHLNIDKVETSSTGSSYTATQFTVGQSDPILGAPLTIQLPEKAKFVRISYSTNPDASGLQWLEPAQTAGKQNPFMFTQSEAIHARSWIPLQDSPQVRVTYTARVRTPRNLLAVMSAENEPNTPHDGDYSFRMPQPIPSYLIALAVGDLSFKPLGKRTGVYAEPSVVEKAASEFSDTEKMVEATEKLYGPYRWGRYDLLVLPPSFPYGGMENPRLTFATPTVLAGDKSLVSLVAHELAHSWSGNLVTNATWRDFWLNEGFTVYLERRILETVYGRSREEMEAALGLRDLHDELARLEDRDEILHIDLAGRDPEEGSTDIPYEKGALFLRHLEQTFGRERFDRFLRSYFDHFAFQSITTDQFLDYLKTNLLNENPSLAAQVPVDEWINRPGLPANAPSPTSSAFSKVEEQAQRWMRGVIPASSILTSNWTTQEWLHFLKSLPLEGEKAEATRAVVLALDRKRMAELDDAFHLTQSGNSEIAFQWLMMSIKNRFEPAYPRLEDFLMTIGRRKFIKPLYEELAKTPEGRERALAIYRRARSTYHPISVASIDEVLKWKTALLDQP
ncbi:MAG: M1 family metallopeptidase [Acidobacteriota bacterium]|nr:M1 family metallopeptidase [Acidobacteriota bacterium]